jgi:hypothetical protein
MMKISFVVLLLQGCTFYGGLSMHLETKDAPEFYAPNPIGILGLEKKHKQFTGFCEHRSSIPYYETGWGLNECGVKYTFNQ